MKCINVSMGKRLSQGVQRLYKSYLKLDIRQLLMDCMVREFQIENGCVLDDIGVADYS